MRSRTGHNVHVTKASCHLQAIPSSASPEEAAAIVAALERFVRDTAPTPSAGTPPRSDGWHAAAVLEGVSQAPSAAAADAWLGTPEHSPG
jgi:hypothetical protein